MRSSTWLTEPMQECNEIHDMETGANHKVLSSFYVHVVHPIMDYAFIALITMMLKTWRQT